LRNVGPQNPLLFENIQEMSLWGGKVATVKPLKVTGFEDRHFAISSAALADGKGPLRLFIDIEGTKLVLGTLRDGVADQMSLTVDILCGDTTPYVFSITGEGEVHLTGSFHEVELPDYYDSDDDELGPPPYDSDSDDDDDVPQLEAEPPKIEDVTDKMDVSPQPQPQQGKKGKKGPQGQPQGQQVQQKVQQGRQQGKPGQQGQQAKGQQQGKQQGKGQQGKGKQGQQPKSLAEVAQPVIPLVVQANTPPSEGKKKRKRNKRPADGTPAASQQPQKKQRTDQK